VSDVIDVSDERAAWTDVTLHHGYWIHADATGHGRWCWLPGVEETPARVVWRDAHGLVGWAPAPVFGTPDEDAWTYAAPGRLFDADLRSAILEAEEARRGAWTEEEENAPPPSPPAPWLRAPAPSAPSARSASSSTGSSGLGGMGKLVGKLVGALAMVLRR
jgi:hypothetical protein